jgi:hypothetical protein
LVILAGLRHLSGAVERERRKMPIDVDIHEHEVLGPMLREEREEGRREGGGKAVRRANSPCFAARSRSASALCPSGRVKGWWP